MPSTNLGPYNKPRSTSSNRNQSHEIYQSPYYQKNLEGQYINQATDKLFAGFFAELKRLGINQYILTADELGISELEKGFNIIPNKATEDLEFRRARLLNRNTTKPPFTLEYLKQKLDSVLGAGSYSAQVDYPNYTLTVECNARDANWFTEISIVVGQIIPANIVYISKPLLTKTISLAELIDYATQISNYRLGTTWILGKKPFITNEAGGQLKPQEVRSLAQAYLNDIANFSAQDVAKVKINGTVEITDFTIKQATGAEANIEYAVEPGTVTEINQIALYNAAGELLENASVYVPVVSRIIVRHKITIKESE